MPVPAFFLQRMEKTMKKVALIVAHPDDETLWAGGTILNNPDWQFFVACLCRKNDPDRAAKFGQALKALGAEGVMGDLDDSAELKHVTEAQVQEAIMELLPSRQFDLVITHSIHGEYTKHRRHDEIGRAVIQLWHTGRLQTDELWCFAYEDGYHSYFPVIIEDAPVFTALPHHVWEKKYDIITHIYGFTPDTWEAHTTPKEEAFGQFFSAADAHDWLVKGSVSL